MKQSAHREITADRMRWPKMTTSPGFLPRQSTIGGLRVSEYEAKSICVRKLPKCYLTTVTFDKPDWGVALMLSNNNQTHTRVPVQQEGR
jgi:hypothetical protein